MPFRRALFGLRTLWEENFFGEEHFEESTIRAQSTLWGALFERRTVGGEHYFSGEHFEESTIFPLKNLFLKGIAPDATVDRGRTE